VTESDFHRASDDTVWRSEDEALRQAFAALVADIDDVTMARLALQVARAEYPNLTIEAGMIELAGIARNIRRIIPADASDGRKIEALNTYLFETLGFRGDNVGYGDPRNNYLNDVLSRACGLPSSLSIVYLDVARRLGLDMIGIGLPGHIIVRYVGQAAAGEIFVDPFNSGQVLSRAECVDLVRRLSGGRLPWHDDFLTGVDNRYLLTRLLNNLKGCYARLADARRALRVQHYLLTLHPDAAHELRDRGLILVELQSYRGALADLESYLRLVPNAPDSERVRDTIFDLKKRVSELQ